MTTITSINPEFVTTEGYDYLLFEGKFYRGCTRCHGTGHYSFDGHSSECYQCGNTSAKLGVLVGDRAAADRDALKRRKAKDAREAKKERERLAKLATREAAQLAIKKTHPEMYDFLMSDEATDSKNSFVSSMSYDFRYHLGLRRSWSDRKTAAVLNAMERVAAQDAHANAHPVVEGRIVITGEIVGVKLVESDYGTVKKVTVLDDRGFRVYASLPKALVESAYDAFAAKVEADGHSVYDFGGGSWFLGTDDGYEAGVKGRRLSFTASVEASRDDVSFGFGSRPTKGEWL